MSDDTVRHLARLAEQSSSDRRLLDEATALANQWGELAHGKPGVAGILAALLLQKALAEEIAEGCNASVVEVMATVLAILARARDVEGDEG